MSSTDSKIVIGNESIEGIGESANASQGTVDQGRSQSNSSGDTLHDDNNFQHILENTPHRNIHYYAAGTVVHNYFGTK
jgi:hypothetical protein